MMSVRLASGFAVGLSTALSFAGTTIHVDSNSLPGGNGSTWAGAYTGLQDALAAARLAQGEITIYVAEGTYLPGTLATDTFDLSGLHIEILGGFPPGGGDLASRDPEKHPTVLSGDVNGDDVVSFEMLNPDLSEYESAGLTFENRSDNCGLVVRVVGAESDTTLDGLVIEGGASTGDGAGVYVENAGFSASFCAFRENSASNGAGLYASGSGIFTLSTCRFEHNDASSTGGGAQLALASTVTDCTFFENAAFQLGGGLDAARIDLAETTFERNVARLPVQGGGALSGFARESTVRGCVFRGNAATARGGAVYARGVDTPWGEDEDRKPRLTECLFEENYAGWGGGLYSAYGTILDNCTFVANTAINSSFTSSSGGYGGGANINRYSEARSCTFTRNTGHNSGGGLYADRNVRVTGCLFEQNTLIGEMLFGNFGGGGLAIWRGGVAEDCTFTENHSTTYGGGARALDMYATFTGCTFTENTADYGGGGLAVIETWEESRIEDCVFDANHAGEEGGGVYAWNTDVVRCMFTNNEATHGGGLYQGASLVDSTVRGNTATGYGGGISNTNEVERCVIESNTAGMGGGGIVRARSVVSSLIHANTAGSYGGGIVLYGPVRSSTIVGNTAPVGAAISSATASTSQRELIDTIVWSAAGAARSEAELLSGKFDGVSHSLIEGLATYAGNGNLGDDPLFIDPLGPDGIPSTGDEDFRLSSASPAIDTGSESTTVGLDLDGSARVQSFGSGPDLVDIGAYETADCNANAISDYEEIRDGLMHDGNANGIPDACEGIPCNPGDLAAPYYQLDIDDVLTFLSGFAGGDPIADLAPPAGTLNVDDVLAFLTAFSTGCP